MWRKLTGIRGKARERKGSEKKRKKNPRESDRRKTMTEVAVVVVERDAAFSYG